MVEPAERFTALYRQHRVDIERYVLRRAPEVDVADVVAEVFTVAWRRFDEFDSEHPLPWLYGVARRMLANELRRRSRVRHLSERVKTSSTESVEDHSPAIAQRIVFQQALNGLRELEREAVLLVAWERLELREAALVAGCGTSAFAMRLHRARRRLRVALSEEESPGRSEDADSAVKPSSVTAQLCESRGALRK
ncbi:MAG: RNA polymerase subunit sigma [Pseudonocardiales bacterium]|nr:MAG: RNA polymerase subunit sigma [Pseudonocardiales bacterium]